MAAPVENGGGAIVEGKEKQWKLSTLAAQAGFCQAGNEHSLSGKGKALWTSSGFEFESMQQYDASPYVYRRIKAPNSDDLGHAVATLESAEAGLATSSGMGAVVASVLGLVNAGDTVLVHADTYGGTFDFFTVDVKRFGINVEFVDVLEPSNVEASLSRLAAARVDGAPTKKVVVFLETITNPIIRVADVSAVSAVVKKYGALLIVDNTFATPLRGQPLLQGADLVLHSVTKFLGGHGDLVAGVVVGPSKYVAQATRVAGGWGLSVSSFEAWLSVRGIRTLQVRMERSWATAERLVKQLSASGLVHVVNSAPKCAVFSCEVYGGVEGVSRALAAFRLIKLVPTLGGVTTTLAHPASASHKVVPAEERLKLGIPDGLIRISVGLEDVEDIWGDLLLGLTAAKSEANGVVDKISTLNI